MPTGSDTSTATLAQSSDAADFGSLTEIYRNNPDQDFTPLLLRATRQLESACRRRLAPFGPITENARITGVDTQARNVYGWWAGYGTGYEDYSAFGYGLWKQPIRNVWVREHARAYTEQWSYSNVSLTVVADAVTSTVIDPSLIVGPQPDTGRIELGPGVYFTPGTVVRATYSGGYNPIPDDLVQACLLQATKTALVGAEPQTRQGMSFAELDAEIAVLIDPYMRR